MRRRLPHKLNSPARFALRGFFGVSRTFSPATLGAKTCSLQSWALSC